MQEHMDGQPPRTESPDWHRPRRNWILSSLYTTRVKVSESETNLVVTNKHFLWQFSDAKIVSFPRSLLVIIDHKQTPFKMRESLGD
jgi:hypothetical protein